MAVNNQEITDRYAIYNGDCVEVMQGMPSDKTHLSIHSPPFCGLYQYSSHERDMSNNTRDGFYKHYEFAVRELYRITMPGRVACVHAMDIPNGSNGADGLSDFSGNLIRLYESVGWIFTNRITIWKEPLEVRRRTMMKKLTHQTIVEDSSECGVAGADYLLTFRKRGDNPVPITHPNGFTDYVGDHEVPPDLVREFAGWKGPQIANRLSHWIWRAYASSVWGDIRVGRVLPFQGGRSEDDEKHVHPLQLDVIERCVELWSNPGEVVFTPFMGVGSEVFGAVVRGRKGIGAELKESYFAQAQRNLRNAEETKRGIKQQSELFDSMDMSA